MGVLWFVLEVAGGLQCMVEQYLRMGNGQLHAVDCETTVISTFTVSVGFR